MFEVGFTEIILILGLALLVLGPEKLPKLAAQIGRWTGRAKSMARQLRAQLDQEVNFQEQRTAHGKGESAAKTEPAGSPPVWPPPEPTAPAPEPTASAPVEAVSPAPAATAADPALKSSNE
ncbi:MAG: Sec-independent protein translocase protein TatB [Steroidobacteraceae bacterium]